jgi:4'-phosphopantetheinyl transferase
MHAIESWSAPPGTLDLPNERLHLWRIDLNSPTEELMELLSADEQERAQRLITKRAQTRFIRARGAMRSILGRYLAVPPQSLRFGYGERGKPHLQASSVPVHFNLSHVEGMALLAVADAPVGIDLEQLRQRRDLPGIAARVFPQQTLRELAELQGDDLIQAFFRHWTHLESCTKCMGSGIFGPAQESDPCFATHFIPRPGWIACVASTRPLPPVSTWKSLQYI